MKQFTSQSIWKIAMMAAPVVVFALLFGRYFSLTGSLTLHTDFNTESPSISDVYPRGRAIDREQNLRNGDTYQRIVGEPVYMDVRVPRSFDTVDVTLEYENSDQTLLELGVVTSEIPYAVRLHPFQSMVIDQAIAEWSSLSDPVSGVTLLQREQTVSQEELQSFVTDPPPGARIGTYQFDITPSIVIEGYQPSSSPLVIDRALRGPHQFVTYIGEGETLDATFQVVDTNAGFDVDTLQIELLRNGVVVAEEQLADDGIDIANNESSEEQTVRMLVEDGEEGVYEYRLNTTSDIVITHIETTQRYFVAKNTVQPISSTPTTLYTNAVQLNAVTQHAESTQTITIDQESLHITEAATPFWWTAADRTQNTIVRTIVIPKNDLTLTSKGYIAFTEESFFDPDAQIQSIMQSTILEQLDYIVYRDYSTPTETRSILKQTVTIPLDGIAGDRKDLTFVLSAPGLDREHRTLTIHDATFTFHRAPLWDRFEQRLRAL